MMLSSGFTGLLIMLLMMLYYFAIIGSYNRYGYYNLTYTISLDCLCTDYRESPCLTLRLFMVYPTWHTCTTLGIVT